MAKWTTGNKTLETVLDPAFGLGVFARAIRQVNKECSIKGFDIDENILQQAANIFENERNTSILLMDYMFNDWENRYDGIIATHPISNFRIMTT